MSTMTQSRYQMQINSQRSMKILWWGSTLVFSMIAHGTPGLTQDRTVQSKTSTHSRVEPSSARVRDPWSFDPRTELPSDTGRFTAPYKSFAHYQYPAQCFAIIEVERYKVWTRHEAPWEYEARARDTLPEAVTAIVRACAAQFSVDKVAPEDLRDLYRVARAIRDTNLTRAVVNRRLSFATTDSMRALILEESILDDFESAPLDIASVMATLARLDSLGRPAALSRARAHSRVAQHAYQLFDRTLLRKEIEAWKTAYEMLSHSERSVLDIIVGHLEHSYDSYAAIWDAALALYFFEEGAGKGSNEIDEFYGWLRQHMSHVRDQKFGESEWNVIYQRHVKTPVRTLLGTPTLVKQIPAWRWLTAEGVKKEDAVVRPTPGKVTLFVYHSNPQDLNPNGDAITTREWQAIRSLVERYGPLGLEVIVIYSLNYHPILSFEEQAELLRRRLFDSQMLPPEVVAAVDTIGGYTFLPEPDGRIQRGSGSTSPLREMITLSISGRSRHFLGTHLIDRDGKIAFVKGASNMRVLEAYIRRTLGLPDEESPSKGS
jgi:hypothetical protein